MLTLSHKGKEKLALAKENRKKENLIGQILSSAYARQILVFFMGEISEAPGNTLSLISCDEKISIELNEIPIKELPLLRVAKMLGAQKCSYLLCEDFDTRPASRWQKFSVWNGKAWESSVRVLAE